MGCRAPLRGTEHFSKKANDWGLETVGDLARLVANDEAVPDVDAFASFDVLKAAMAGAHTTVNLGLVALTSTCSTLPRRHLSSGGFALGKRRCRQGISLAWQTSPEGLVCHMANGR